MAKSSGGGSAWVAVACIVALLFLTGGNTRLPDWITSRPQRPSVATSTHSPAGVQAARAQLATLPVKGRAANTGYDRAQFGTRWADIDRNGCDQRNDVLGRDLTNKTYKPGTRQCVVLTGTLNDPYSGKVTQFDKAHASAHQVDHVVALQNAWVTGAQHWTPEKRRQFANDLSNLLLVDGKLNQQKGSGDAATWLPPNKAYRCTYVSKQIAVKSNYGLWVTPAEKASMLRILSGC